MSDAGEGSVIREVRSERKGQSRQSHTKCEWKTWVNLGRAAIQGSLYLSVVSKCPCFIYRIDTFEERKKKFHKITGVDEIEIDDFMKAASTK